MRISETKAALESMSCQCPDGSDTGKGTLREAVRSHGIGTRSMVRKSGTGFSSRQKRKTRLRGDQPEQEDENMLRFHPIATFPRAKSKRSRADRAVVVRPGEPAYGLGWLNSGSA